MRITKHSFFRCSLNRKAHIFKYITGFGSTQFIADFPCKNQIVHFIGQYQWRCCIDVLVNKGAAFSHFAVQLGKKIFLQFFRNMMAYIHHGNIVILSDIHRNIISFILFKLNLYGSRLVFQKFSCIFNQFFGNFYALNFRGFAEFCDQERELA